MAVPPRETESYNARAYQQTYEQLGPPPSKALRRRRISAESADRFGIRWRDRSFVLPVTDRRGRVLGFQSKSHGRYWVTAGTPMKSTLFGLHHATDDRVVVVESPLDVVVLADLGFCAIATFGVPVTDAQCELLRSFKRVVLALDNDDAGIRGTLRVIARMRRVEAVDYRALSTYRKDIGELTPAEARALLARPLPRRQARDILRLMTGA